jgi:hypothetical protein
MLNIGYVEHLIYPSNPFEINEMIRTFDEQEIQLVSCRPAMQKKTITKQDKLHHQAC